MRACRAGSLSWERSAGSRDSGRRGRRRFCALRVFPFCARAHTHTHTHARARTHTHTNPEMHIRHTAHIHTDYAHCVTVCCVTVCCHVCDRSVVIPPAYLLTPQRKSDKHGTGTGVFATLRCYFTCFGAPARRVFPDHLITLISRLWVTHRRRRRRNAGKLFLLLTHSK